MTPNCNREQSIHCVAELIKGNPEIKAAAPGVVVAVHELFLQYPFAIGMKVAARKAAFVDAKIYDIVSIVRKYLEDAANASAREVARRAKRKQYPEFGGEADPEARQRIAEGFKSLAAKLQKIPDPVPPRAGKCGHSLGPAPYQSTLDMDRLIASAEASERR